MNQFNICIRGVILLLFFTFSMQSCKKEQKKTIKEVEVLKKENVIEILTTNMEFQMSDTISSGWNTFRYINQSTQTHFFIIEKYPDSLSENPKSLWEGKVAEFGGAILSFKEELSTSSISIIFIFSNILSLDET